jgi:hypothetical protein
MASIDLWWLPLGAGGWFVTLNGRVYEALHALVERRRPRPWLAGGPGHGPPPGARPAQRRSCSRTVAAWPSALTLCQARSTRPCSSSRKVERSTPSEVRP